MISQNFFNMSDSFIHVLYFMFKLNLDNYLCSFIIKNPIQISGTILAGKHLNMGY